MRWLLSLSLVLVFASCVDTTSQSHILTQAKAEVAQREIWADQAYIRIEKAPRQNYVMWRDLSWKVSAGAFDYTDFPNFKGIRVLPGTERELTFSRDGCLTGYRQRNRNCANAPYVSSEPTWTAK